MTGRSGRYQLKLPIWEFAELHGRDREQEQAGAEDEAKARSKASNPAKAVSEATEVTSEAGQQGDVNKTAVPEQGL